MRIDWNVVGICVAVVFCGLLLLKPLGCGFERLKSLPRELLVLFLSFAIVAAVEADKTNSTTRALMRQHVGLPAMVTQEEIARGYRLGYVTNDVDHSHAMPTNAVYLGNAHIRGAASGFGRNRLDFGEWSFPFGSNDTSYSSIWWFHDGRIRMSPRDPSGEISSGASNVVAVHGGCCVFLRCAHADGEAWQLSRWIRNGVPWRLGCVAVAVAGNGHFQRRNCVYELGRGDSCRFRHWRGDGGIHAFHKHVGSCGRQGQAALAEPRANRQSRCFLIKLRLQPQLLLAGRGGGKGAVRTNNVNRKEKNMKTLAAAAMALSLALTAHAVPTENTFAAVTNDWYVGRWTNVLELAQTRLAANSNDLVGAHLVVSYDVLFSDIPAISNSVTRLIGAMDASSEPAITNLLSELRPGWVYFRDEFLPRQTAVDVQAQHEKSSITNKTLDCDFILKQIWDNGLW